MKLSHSYTREIVALPPYDFELTVRKPAGWPLFTPFEVWDSDTLWTATHMDGVLTGLRLSSCGDVGEPRVKVELFLAKRVVPKRLDDLVGRLTESIGANDDLSEFYRMAERDPILRIAVNDHHGMHSTSNDSLFPDGLLAICLQMAPIKRSNEMMACLISRYGERAEFDDRSIPVWPLPHEIAQVDPSELRERCKLGYRAKFIVALARAFRSGFPAPQRLLSMEPEEAKKVLMKLPGIGDYSSDIINPHGGFPIDAWSADVFGMLFHGKVPEDRRGSVERIKREGMERWGRWSWLAFLYIVHDLENLSNRLGIELRRS